MIKTRVFNRGTALECINRFTRCL